MSCQSGRVQRFAASGGHLPRHPHRIAFDLPRQAVPAAGDALAAGAASGCPVADLAEDHAGVLIAAVDRDPQPRRQRPGLDAGEAIDPRSPPRLGHPRHGHVQIVQRSQHAQAELVAGHADVGRIVFAHRIKHEVQRAAGDARVVSGAVHRRVQQDLLPGARIADAGHGRDLAGRQSR